MTVFLRMAAFWGLFPPIEHFTKENWAKTIGNNVVGTFVTVKSAIPYMKERGGSIVLTSSVSGSRQFAQEGFSAYSTFKAAIAAFSKMAALELAQYRIRVNAICPGSIDTNIFESMDESERTKDIHFPIDIPKNAIYEKNGPARAGCQLVCFSSFRRRFLYHRNRSVCRRGGDAFKGITHPLPA
ncbi:SDR family oxidoreductase [Domibacillus sp. DTU_2020_1001157_1_SI_ALB_TIR_016]|nr:SDR family NAD(P)-dependent oxidoreductase [Domibacillus sp. DTU_2020_1001157_1_SI_ALB_TIR_016]WNS81440.1 SDR family oxidoreductase [Domibacillus sp. DTU_2020_1001157_1_SI_ALB_TIR_016]